MVQSLQAQQRSVHGKQAKDLVLQNINIFHLLKTNWHCNAVGYFPSVSKSNLCFFSDFKKKFGLVGLICQVDIPLKTCWDCCVAKCILWVWLEAKWVSVGLSLEVIRLAYNDIHCTVGLVCLSVSFSPSQFLIICYLASGSCVSAIASAFSWTW